MSVLISLCVMVSVFYVLAVLTEDFFVPAIDILTKKLKLSSDAAGATLLAAGSSAPEFFTATIAISGWRGVAMQTLGLAPSSAQLSLTCWSLLEISAMFRSVHLQWKPVLRDLLVYVVAVILLMLTFLDGEIVLYEAASFVALYFVYVFLAIKWRKWFKYEDQAMAEVEEQDTAEGNKLNSLTKKLLSPIVQDVNVKPERYLITFFASIVLIAGHELGVGRTNSCNSRRR